MKPLSDKQLGALGEKLAAEYLKTIGYKILTKNYKCRYGEIDIIARDGDEIVFAEVKSRSDAPYVRGMYAVDKRKQEHIIRASAHYLAENKVKLQPRYDVIEVEIERSTGRQASLNHIPAAFIQPGPYSRY